MEGLEMKNELQITLKITDTKGIILGRSVILFNKPRCAVGLWNDSVVFAVLEPKTMPECQVLVYTVEELREFAKEGNLEGMVDL